MCVFRYLFWLVLVIVFIAGANRISIFGLGYLMACFYLLLFGTAMLRWSLRARLILWDCLILYNVTVIIAKNMLSVRLRFPANPSLSQTKRCQARVIHIKAVDPDFFSVQNTQVFGLNADNPFCAVCDSLSVSASSSPASSSSKCRTTSVGSFSSSAWPAPSRVTMTVSIFC